ncbi:MAG: adenylate/guanylate cyclase domain-containing protein [Candidatus Riflebacteria bacterium]|nr:adenylate/guanylate cyclase domain-containing protein [Candidatus Riflebacteria bacterium]
MQIQKKFHDNTTARNRRQGRIATDSILLFCVSVAFIIIFSGFFARLDNWLHDNWLDLRLKLRVRSSGSQSLMNALFPVDEPSRDIVVVTIDDRSILGIPGLFQGNRRIFAQAIKNLSACKPRVIALDVFFAANSTEDQSQDTELAKAVGEAGNVVLRAYRRDDRRMTLPYPELSRSGTPAPSYFRSHRDESIRSVSMKFTSEAGKTTPSFQTEVIRQFYGLKPGDVQFSDNKLILELKGQQIHLPLSGGEYLWLNYDNPTRAYQTISFYELYNNSFPHEGLKDKLVIIGYANSMTEEKFFTPLGGNDFSPYLNALVFRNLLNKSALAPPDRMVTVGLAAILLAVFLFIIFTYFNPVAFVIISFVTIAGLIGCSLASLTLYKTLLDVTPAVSLLLIALSYTIGKKYYFELSEKLRIKHAFQHYVTASVVNEMLKDPSKLNLHGEERILTIFFSDIEGFTSLSEGMSPLDVVSLLNEYLSEMTEIIFKYDGLLDKYEGDAIMAVFGAPIDQKDHAIRACRCALENQKALARLREKWRKEGKPEIKARIGINTGVVVVGNMGSTMRFDYTVIGDNVNIAARLETANKLFQSEVLVSEATATLAESAIMSRRLGKLKVAGKDKQVYVYEVLAEQTDSDKVYLEKAVACKTAYDLCQAALDIRDFAEAERLLANHLAKHAYDNPARILHNRIKGFLIVPPPPGWENIITQESK